MIYTHNELMSAAMASNKADRFEAMADQIEAIEAEGFKRYCNVWRRPNVALTADDKAEIMASVVSEHIRLDELTNVGEALAECHEIGFVATLADWRQACLDQGLIELNGSQGLTFTTERDDDE